jgi:hypothetical protein
MFLNQKLILNLHRSILRFKTICNSS